MWCLLVWIAGVLFTVFYAIKYALAGVITPLGGILLVLLTAFDIWTLKSVLVERHYRKSVMEKPFVCPNCGHVFSVKLFQMPLRLHSYMASESILVKCPKCKTRDHCKRPYSEE